MHFVSIKIQFKWVGIALERQEKSRIEGLIRTKHLHSSTKCLNHLQLERTHKFYLKQCYSYACAI